MAKKKKDPGLLAEMETDAAPPEAPPDDDPTMARLVALGEELESLKAEIDDLKEQEKAKQERYDILRKNTIPDLMQKVGLVGDDGRGRFTIGSGALISLTTTLHAGYTRANESKVFNWLRRNKMASVIRPTVHPQTFKALIREQLSEGRPIPPFVNQFYETSATIRKG